MDENDEVKRRPVAANPYRGSKTGPGGDSWAPGETQVSGPEDYRDPWNPRFERLRRLRRVVRDWIGGGG